MDNIGILYDHLEFLMPFGVFYGHSVGFVVILYRFSVLPEKSGNTVKN
jgi:hypothetical protein